MEVKVTKTKKTKKFKFTAKVQDQITELDYWTKLDDEQKQWLNEFHDGALNNNHRFYPMFTEHPEYETRIKKEIYNETNCRNRDIYADKKVRKKLDSMDHLSGTHEESFISKLLVKQMSKKEKESLLINFGLKSFEECIRGLIEETVFDVKNKPDEIDPTYKMLQFYITMNALIKEEIKQRRSK